MKKFSEWIGSIREAEQKKANEMQLSHVDYMNAKLEKFGASKISELDEEKRNEFFAEIVAEFEAVGAKPVAEEKTEETPAAKEAETPKEAETLEEAEIKSADEFKKYAIDVLKKAHGEDYDDAKAQETIDGIMKKCGEDWGACVGMINKSMGG